MLPLDLGPVCVLPIHEDKEGQDKVDWNWEIQVIDGDDTNSEITNYPNGEKADS